MMGGIALFLYGMKVMSNSLEKLAGNRLKAILGKMTSNTGKGFLLGLLVTVIIQSSAATVVMVVGFVNSGLMSVIQASGVIMGANIGTAVTGWIVSISGIKNSGIIYYALLFAGVILFWFFKKQKHKSVGLIIIGFSILMIGMQTMSAAVSGLKNSDTLAGLYSFLSNPALGFLIGVFFTVLIQSSSASVGVLQSFAIASPVPVSLCIPFIIGTNIGTCSTVLISSIGAAKDARRTALFDVFYNLFSAVIVLPVYYLIYRIASPAVLKAEVGAVGIAVTNSILKVLIFLIALPFVRFIVRFVSKIVPDKINDSDKTSLLDERLLNTPAIALEQARIVTLAMAELSIESIRKAVACIFSYSAETVEEVEQEEEQADLYEDKLGTYLVRLSGANLLPFEHREVNKLLHLISDYERISDHANNIVASATEIYEKKVSFSEQAESDLKVIFSAVDEILDLSFKCFRDDDLHTAALVEPLEQVVDLLKDSIKSRHIERLQKGNCTVESGFILTDILTDVERVSDHCSNIACCEIEIAHKEMELHEYIKGIKSNGTFFQDNYDRYREKYSLKA